MAKHFLLTNREDFDLISEFEKSYFSNFNSLKKMLDDAGSEEEKYRNV